jgi:hypothetical protein
MKIMMKWLLILLAVGIVAVVIYLVIYFRSQTDVKDVHLQGYVYDRSSNTALQDVRIKITNWRYTSDSGKKNYDEYLGKDTVTLTTNAHGFFSTDFPLSAQINMELEKTGYKEEVKTIQKISKNISLDVILEKNDKN